MERRGRKMNAYGIPIIKRVLILKGSGEKVIQCERERSGMNAEGIGVRRLLILKEI